MKSLHKNATFWLRFLTHLIDFCVFSSIIILFWKMLNIQSNQINQTKWYTFLSLNWFSSFILFYLIPYFNNYRTIGLIITRLQVINMKQKRPQWLVTLCLSSMSFGFYSILSVIFLAGIWPYQIAILNDVNINANLSKLPLNLQIVARIIGTLVSIWTLLNLFNHGLIIGTKKRYGIYERAWSFRICYIKHYTKSQQLKKVKLLPYRTEKIEVIFI